MEHHITRTLPLFALALLAACSQPQDEKQPQTQEQTAAAGFLDAIKTHCEAAFEGRVVSTDAADADFAKERLVMHVRDCEADVVRIPFHVGEDRSRTWVITTLEDGYRLKHDHRHEDGSEDAVTQYGGDSASPAALTASGATRVEFPVDTFSIAMFEREGLSASVTNIWAVEIDPGKLFAYELSRENRFFRVEFDLTQPVEAPPAPWGAE